ncbi:MAG: T9SS type A sorting domain-containing protein [Candidatus Tenebribacter davisii]|nr:T9SS type A sorting domain-containing protein [Candidatus Tenebribacter davisii]
MKKTIVSYIALLFIISLSNLAFAQVTHTIDFETGGVGADWNWTMAENGDNPPLEFIANPVSGGINTTATVAKFTARVDGNPWALCHTSDDGEYTFDATNSTITIMVYKTEISDIGFKVEGMSGNYQIIVPNTVTDQWEEISFDFSGQIGNTYGTMVIIPDFTARAQENIIYFDNIQAPDGEVSGPLPEPTVAAPVPTVPAADVISVFSDEYTDIAGTNFNPGWGQTTVVTTEEIGGNFMMKYDNFNYQGTEFVGAQDLSSMDYMHIDMWTPNATVVKVTPISASTGENLTYITPIEIESWNSYDIPLADFAGVSMADIVQLKFDGQEGVNPSVLYLDNIYFYSSSAPGTDATLSDLQVDGTTVAGFSPAVLNYDVELPEGTSVVPAVTAATTDPAASHVVNDAASLPGTTTVTVTAEDGTTTLTYSVNFSVEEPSPEPTVAAPDPTSLPEDVISIYSDAYTDLAGTNFNPGWGQTTIVTFEEIGGNEMMKYDAFNYQGTQLAAAQDLSLMEYIHIDMWTADATVVKATPISTSSGEHLVSLTPIEAGSWNSYDISVEDFTDVSMADIHQLKFDGQEGVTPSTIYLDNIYFWKNPTASGSDATLSDLQVDGTTVAGFDPNILSYDIELPNGTVIVPTVTATTNDPNASHIVNDAAVLPGTTEVVVTAEDEVTILTYNVIFTLEPPVPTVAAPDPTVPADDVISIFSGSYTSIEGTNFNPGWGQTTIVTFEDIGGNNMMKYDNFNYQGTEFDGAQDLSAMDYMHIDMWTHNASVVKMTPISASTGEYLVSLTPIEVETWNSYNIPLGDFTGVSMADIFQLKFDGQEGVTPSTIYLDNIYFYSDASPSFNPPSNVQSTVQDYNDVLVTWELPGGAVGEWFGWDDGTNGNSLGLQGGTAPYTFSSASKWDPDMLTAYDGLALMRVEIFVNDPADFTLKIWSGADAGTVEYEQVIADYIVGEFNEIILDTPHIIDASTHLWFGYDVSHDEGMHPAGTDLGPSIEGYGDMCYFNNLWQPLTPLGFAYNFNLQAYVEGSDGEVVALTPSKSKTTAPSLSRIGTSSRLNNGMFEAASSRKRVITQQHNSNSRSLAGYEVYRDGSWIADISDPAIVDYLDEGLEAGSYDYYVIATYTDPTGESEPSNTATADVVLAAPTNVSGNSVWPNIVVIWTTLGARDIESYIIYRDGTEIGTSNSGLYVDGNVSTGTYIYNVAGVFTGGFVGPMSEDSAPVEHTGAGGILVPMVTSLDGNYPNPFNPTTMIKYGLSEDSFVTLQVYNIKGEKLKTLVNEELEAGYHDIHWNGKDDNGKTTASGVYFYKMKAGNVVETKKMILMK